MKVIMFSQLIYLFILLVARISGIDCEDGNQSQKLQAELERQGLKIDIFNPPGDFIHGFQTILPDLSEITSKISPEEFIYDQSQEFRKYIVKLEQILNKFEDPVDLAQVIYGLSQEPSLNKGIWFRAVIRCLAHRKDVNLFTMPRLFEIAPSMSFSSDTMELLKEQSNLPKAQRACVIVDENFGSDNGRENELWYFREDIMVNSNHWYWHIYYPVTGATQHADRRGELFFEFHHGLISRYRTERLCNSLDPIQPFVLERGNVVKEGYRSHLTDSNSRQNWTDRPNNLLLQERTVTSNRNISIDDAMTFRQRILTGINNKSFLLPNNEQLSVDNIQGIDVVGDVLEASMYSINPAYYDAFGYHSMGHYFLGRIVNPINPTGTFIPGIMVDTAINMRDVIFYRWHYHIDSIFQQHKETLQPYQPESGELQLSWPSVTFDKIEVKGRMSNTVNLLRTFWSTTDYTLQNGLDFNSSQAVDVCVKHLNHEAFRYKFSIISELSEAQRAVIRIFLAPRYNEKGKRYSMKDQRNLFFVLDTFSVELEPGKNTIRRESIDSTLTIPNTSPPRNEECNCGWPDHLLLPKGKPTGMSFDIFGMVTQEEITSIPSRRNSSQEGELENKQANSQPCLGAYLYCGILGAEFPDRRPMGYPFDRLPFSIQQGQTSRIVSNLDEYIQPNPNMATAKINIFHYNQVINDP